MARRQSQTYRVKLLRKSECSTRSRGRASGKSGGTAADGESQDVVVITATPSEATTGAVTAVLTITKKTLTTLANRPLALCSIMN